MRAAMIPIFLFFYIAEPFGGEINFIASASVFAVASASDWLDGYVARKKNLLTNFGALMDPLADKLLVAAALVAMVSRQAVPAWAAVVLISRELFISGFRQLVLEQDSKRVMAASVLAKYKTAFQMAAVILLLLDISVLSTVRSYAAMPLLYVSVALSLVSAAEYVIKNKIKWQL